MFPRKCARWSQLAAQCVLAQLNHCSRYLSAAAAAVVVVVVVAAAAAVAVVVAAATVVVVVIAAAAVVVIVVVVVVVVVEMTFAVCLHTPGEDWSLSNSSPKQFILCRLCVHFFQFFSV